MGVVFAPGCVRQETSAWRQGNLSGSTIANNVLPVCNGVLRKRSNTQKKRQGRKGTIIRRFQRLTWWGVPVGRK